MVDIVDVRVGFGVAVFCVIRSSRIANAGACYKFIILRVGICNEQSTKLTR